jgi:hypothetical protein
MENGSLPDKVEFDKSSPSGEVSFSNTNGNANDVPSDTKKPRKKPFYVNAFFALLTFFASGVYHEYLNHFSFGGSDGSNMIFFMAQGFATVVYAALRKSFGKQMDSMPGWLGVMFSTGFVWATSPYCEFFLWFWYLWLKTDG